MSEELVTNVMTTRQVAEYLQMDEATITKFAKSGKIPGKKVGHLWRFHRDVIDEWLRMSPEKEATQ